MSRDPGTPTSAEPLEADYGGCGEWPEHDWQVRDEADGVTVYECRRCGAETTSEDG